MACGDIDHGDGDDEDLCRFQWYRSLPDVDAAAGSDAPAAPAAGGPGAQPAAILGAFSPVYFVSPDDVGCVLSVVVKVDDAPDGEDADGSGSGGDAPDGVRRAVADGGKVVIIGPNMKK